MARIAVPYETNITDRPAVLWVGRDPGLHEVNERRPFVGKAGNKLIEEINSVGWRRKDCNYANLVPWKPWNNEFWRHSDEDIHEGIKRLKQHIQTLHPSLVVALGNEAAYALIPNYEDLTGSGSIKSAKGITDIRGFFFYNEDLAVWIMASFHPSAVLYQQSQQIQFSIDIRRARDYIDGKLPRLTMPEPEIVINPPQLDRYRESKLTAFDIETEWGGSRLQCMAFAGDDLKPAVVYGNHLWAARQYLNTNYPKVAHNGKFDQFFLTHFEQCPVAGLNDDTMALHWAMYPELAGRPDTGGEDRNEYKKKSSGMTRKGLLFLASMYLNCPWWKSYDHNDIEKMARLCAQDVWVTRMLYDIMYPKAEAMGVIPQYRECMELIPSLVRVQQRGLKVDNELRRERIRSLRKRRDEHLEEINTAALKYIRGHQLDFFRHTKQCSCCNGVGTRCWRCAGLEESPTRKSQYTPVIPARAKLADYTVAQLKELLPECRECKAIGKTSWYEFKYRSSQQVKELIFKELGAPMSCVVKGSFATQDTLRKVYEEWATQSTSRHDLAERRSICATILGPYFTAKKDDSQQEIYVRLKPNKDGAIRNELSPYRVVTGRLASGDTFLIESTNLQNLSKATAYEDPLYAVREVIIPRPGFVFLCADYEKAEAVVASADSEDWEFYNKLIAGEDIHAWHAELYMGETNEINRQICKEITYASYYIATPNTVQQRINRNYHKTGIKLDLATVEQYHRHHLDLHPLERWWDTVLRDAKANDWWQENPFGLRRKFENPNFHDRHKQMVNWRCQSTVASAVNKAWRTIWKTLDYDGLHYLVHQIHDEIMMEVREDMHQDIAVQMKSIMERPFTIRGKEVYIPVEVCVAPENWHNKKKI